MKRYIKSSTTNFGHIEDLANRIVDFLNSYDVLQGAEFYDDFGNAIPAVDAYISYLQDDTQIESILDYLHFTFRYNLEVYNEDPNEYSEYGKWAEEALDLYNEVKALL